MAMAGLSTVDQIGAALGASRALRGTCKEAPCAHDHDLVRVHPVERSVLVFLMRASKSYRRVSRHRPSPVWNHASGVAAVAVVLMIGCHRGVPDATASLAPGVISAEKTSPAAVRVAVVVEHPVPRILRVTGQLEGMRDARVAADTTGKVREAAFERGAMVDAGSVLVRVDDRSAALNLKEAEAAMALAIARLALARSEVERHAPLVGSKAIAAGDFRRMEAERDVREADLLAVTARRDLARKALEDSVVRAPFAGVVAERLVEPGEMLKPDSVVARIVDVARLRLELNIPETAAASVREGQPVTFTVAAQPGAAFRGAIRHVGGSVRRTARDLVVEAEVDNRDGRLRPGYFAEARVATGEAKAATVPAAAVRTDGARRSVFVVKGDVVEERLVELGESGDGWIEVRSGLAPGDNVVVSADTVLSDGLPIVPVKP